MIIFIIKHNNKFFPKVKHFILFPLKKHFFLLITLVKNLVSLRKKNTSKNRENKIVGKG